MTDNQNESPTPSDTLIRAVLRRDTQALRDALHEGVDPNQAVEGVMPMHIAALTGQAEPIRWLAKHGARADARDALGRTPLHYAGMCSTPGSGVIRALIDSGASVNPKDSHGCTPLDLAAGARNQDAALMLIEAGATCRPDRRAWVQRVGTGSVEADAGNGGGPGASEPRPSGRGRG